MGRLDNGLKVYSYKYKGDETPRIGLIAQEVRKLYPESVVEDEDTGLLKVDYGSAKRKGIRA